MSLTANTMQYLNQCGGLLTYVDIEDGGKAVAYKLVPVAHWHNGQKFPHSVEKDLRENVFRRTTVEGLEYYLVPESTTNAVGHVAYYAENGQENLAASETKEAIDTPPAVRKYLKTEREDRKITRLG